MTVAGYVGSWGPWLALIVSGAAAAVRLVVLLRYGRGEHGDARALSALPIGGFGAALGLLVALVPYLIVLPPTAEPVVLAATRSEVWRGSAVLVVAVWLCVMSAAVGVGCRFRSRHMSDVHQHV